MKLLCALEDLPDQNSKGFSLDEQALFVVRQGQTVFAYRNQCPHLGIPLEWLPDKFLDMDAELIQCSTHGALFTIEDGLCVSGPCSGQSLSEIAVQIIDGQVWLAL